MGLPDLVGTARGAEELFSYRVPMRVDIIGSRQVCGATYWA